MFNKITPEEAGISSKNVINFIDSIERAGIVNHSILIMKGNNIFAEYYWKPFDKEKVHRMYSQTKSFVSIAIGILCDDGLLNIDDKICSFFPEKIDKPLPTYLSNMTVRDMLTMQTCGETPYWFYYDDPDRTHLYLNENTSTIPSGMRWCYDSPGSQVLSSLVEKISGKSLFDFLNERIFKHLGTFKNASILKTKTEDSFGDSALLCTSRDIASFARLLMNGGMWNGKQLISKEYIEKATSNIVSNMETGFDDIMSKGYGYQIWRVAYNGFAFNGMGGQLTLCFPEKDIIFVCTGDNQGFAAAKSLMVNNFYNYIYENIESSPLPENKKAANDAINLNNSLELYSIKGNNYSEFQDILCGKKYYCEENPTGITEFMFKFNENGGKFIYKNSQGEKTLPFGINKNVYCKFPQLGYSDLHTCLPSKNPDFMYDCAVSACWAEKQKIMMKVQIIDTYLGNMFAIFSFKDDYATVTMKKYAEAFLDEYEGEFVAKSK